MRDTGVEMRRGRVRSEFCFCAGGNDQRVGDGVVFGRWLFGARYRRHSRGAHAAVEVDC